MSTAKFLNNNKTTENCFLTDILRASLNCLTTLIKILQFEERMVFYDHLF